jgi:hypothetical protein
VSHTVKSRDYYEKKRWNNVRRFQVEGEVGAIAKLITRDTELTRKDDSAAEERETDKARQMKTKIIFGLLSQVI